MLFNSYEFTCVFLPVTVAVFYALGRGSRDWALGWLIAASIFFYAWWRPFNVAIIAPSIVVNFVLARYLRGLAKGTRPGWAQGVLAGGILFNILFLGYFKYANFGVTVVNDLVGTRYVLEQIILPLGISFITFQKIALLIDAHAGRIEPFTLRDYCLFVLFFPQLIAGPIVHLRELMPQFRRCSCRFDAGEISVGLTLFAFGLFKKVCIADKLAGMVGDSFERAATGQPLSLLPAWLAALGFTFQIYFDFSGYSDMAVGAARLFGVKLPANFDSPLRSSSMIDFWLRWHMSLTRFLTAYVYNPLALALTRRRLASGRKAISGRDTTLGAFAQLLVLPTLVTMVVSGVWHGAGYLFIVWGVLHGVYLSVNHGWRLLASRVWRNKPAYDRVMTPVGFVLTFVCVVVSMVVFRASTGTEVRSILAGMAGLNGVDVPTVIWSRLGPLVPLLQGLGLSEAVETGGPSVIGSVARVGAFGLVALLCPNTLELLRKHEPALGWKPTKRHVPWLGDLTAWKASPIWTAVVSVVAIAGLLNLGGVSEFLYWQF